MSNLPWRDLASVAVGGACGAMLRFMIGWSMERWNVAFPYATLIVNLVGCLLLGGLSVYFSQHANLTTPWQLLLTTGFLGAFTTFSTFAVDTLRLWDSQQQGLAALNVILQLSLGLWAARCGAWLVQTVWPTSG